MPPKKNKGKAAHVKEFQDVDQAQAPHGLMRMMDAFTHYPGMGALHLAADSLCGISEGISVLDLACGAGLETLRHARMVGPLGRVAGVDKSRFFLDEAKKRAGAFGLENVDYRQADASNLPFEDNTFDVARTERLLMYLANPRRTLSEMRRVIKPGGHAYAIEPDWETFTINLSNRDLVRKVFHFVCDNHFAQGWIGRELPGHFKACGFSGIQVQSRTVILSPQAIGTVVLDFAQSAMEAKVLTRQENGQWQREVSQLMKTGDLFMTQTMVLVVGEKD